jgi:prevent-host-death family protein
MTETMNVADAKKRLSELMSRVAYNNERFLVQRRGKPMAALVSAEDLLILEQQKAPVRGLLSAAGACADFDDFELMIENIYVQRGRAEDRPVDLDE